MKQYGRRVLSWMLAVALLVTCSISGLVLPAMADTVINLFPNGDFEGFGESTPVVAPWTAHNSNANWTIREGAGVDGSWGLELTGSSNGSYVKFATKPTFEDGATYRLAWRAKVDPARKGGANAGYVQLYTTTGLTYVNQSAAATYLKASTVAGEWISYYMDFTAAKDGDKVPSIDSSWGMIVAGVAAGVCFDDFTLTKIADNTEREILLDGDFEKGADSSLFGSSVNESYTTLSREEVGYIGVDPDDANNRVMVFKSSENGWTSAYFRGLHADAGKSYVLAFDYKGGGFSMFSNAVYSNYNDDAVQSLAFEAKDEWTHVEVKINSLTDAKQWFTSFEKRNGNQTANTYIDNMSLKEYKEIVLTGIALNTTTATLDEGNTTTLTVTVQPDGAPMPTIVWTSSDDTVATVADGVVTAVKAGTATITAKAGDFTATCTVTVEAVNASELFPNGDFEGFGEEPAVVAPWTAHNSATTNWTIREGAGVDGSWGMELTGSAHGTYVKFPTKPTFEDGATYRLSWRAKVDPARKGYTNAGYVQLYTTTGLTYINKSSNTVYLKSASVAGQWITYYIDFTAAKDGDKVPSIDASWGMYVRGAAVGVCFDDFSLVKIEDNSERDILMDGDFEKGADSALFGSSLNESYTILAREAVGYVGTDPADANNRVMVLKASDAGWTSAYFRGLHAEAGKSYVMSFEYKGGGFTAWINPVYSTYNDDNATTVSFGAQDEWTHAEVIIHSVSEANNWLTSFEKRLGNHTADTYIDNLSLKEYKAIAPTGIALNTTTATLDEGNTTTLTVTVQPDGAPMPTIVWTSSDDTVATVADGVVTAVKAGTATITAKAGDFTATCTVTVEAVIIPATSIELNTATATVVKGETVTLTVTAKPAGAVMPTITWTSSDETVATVADGVVTGIKAGTATITATADGLAPVTCEVTVASTDGNVIVNGNFELGANAAWGGSANVQDGVGKDGSVGLKSERAEGNGDWDSGKGTYYKEELFSILKPKTKYTLSFEYKNEGAGQGQVQLVPKIGTTADGKDLFNIVLQSGDVDWTTYSVVFTTPESLTVATGYEANFRSYGKPGVTYFDNIKLIEAPAATAIVLDKAEAKVTEGKNFVLTLTTTPDVANVPDAVWTSSDETVATVADGVVTGVKAGTATITVTAGTLSASCTVVVELDDGNIIENGNFEQGAAVAWGGSANVQNGFGKDGSVGLKSERAEGSGAWDSGSGAYYKLPLFSVLKPNTKYTLSFEYKNEGKGQGQVQLNPMIGTTADGKTLNNIVLKTGDVDWTAYSVVFTTPESLTVSEGFEVTFRSYGEQGVTYYDNIKLIEAPAATAIALDKANAKVKEGKDFVLTLTTTPEVANVPNAVWTSSDETVATVADGVVTGVKAGSATITVTAGELTASCTVTVEEDDGNLLENGDFEQGATVSWGGSANVQDGVGKDGSVGLKLTTDMAEGATSHQQPSVWYKGDFVSLLEPDTVYQLSVDVKHEGLGFGAHLTMMSLGTLDNGKDFNGAVELAKGDTDWNTVTVTFSTPSNALTASKGYEWNLCQVHYAGSVGTGAMYFDNAKLIKVGKVDFADAIAIAPDEAELLPNDSISLKAMTTPANTATGVLTWESSDPTIATVDANGVVTATDKCGTVTITVTSNKGMTDTATVVVREDANLIKNGSFEQGGAYWGNTDRIVAGLGKDGGYGLKLVGENKSTYYKSSLAAMQPNTKYMMTFDYFNTKGAIWRFWSAAFGTDFKKLPKLETDGNWHSATVIFTTPADMPLSSGWDLAIVSDIEGEEPARIDNLCLRKYNTGVDAEKLMLSESAITIIPGRTATLTPYAEPSDSDLNDMTWTSDNHNVAIVEYGLVKGVGKGTATITATTKNGKSATCTVTVSGGDTMLKNPTFDMETLEWALENGAEVAEGEGRLGSNALKLVKEASASQTVSGLKPSTTYELRINARTNGGAATVTLADGETVLLTGATAANKTWKETVLEFTTPDTVSDTATLTIAMAGAGPIYIDNVILNAKASLVDFVVSDLFWVGGGYQVVPDTEITFAVTVVNEGEDPVKAGSVVEVDICKNGTVITTLKQTLEAELATGGSVVMAAETPWAAEAGHWVISARANPRLSILEMNDVNNTTQKQLRVDEEILTPPAETIGFDMTELTFSDEFDSLTSIDQMASGKDGYKWYVTRNWGAGTVQPDDYSIEDGVVTLKAKQAGFNITLSTIDVNTHNGYTWNKGYLEVRLRIPYADPEFEGGSPAVWSFPKGKWLDIPGETNQWVEMDWMEYWGYRDQFPGGYYTSAFHEQVQGVEGKKDHWFTNGNASLEGLGDEQWHTMGWLWVENAVIGYLDGVENFRLTYSEDDIPGQKVTVRSGDPDAYGAYAMMNEQFNALFIGGGYQNPMEVDYVRIWQTQGETPTLPDVPEEEETPEIEVDAYTWWYNYCTDIYGDNITEVTYDNYLTVLGAESVDSEYTAQTLWERVSAKSKAEINEMLAANGQPTFDELLAAALAMAERVKGGWTPEDDQGGAGDSEADDENATDTDEPNVEEPDEDKPQDNTPEDNAPTGATTVLPIVLAVVLVACIVAMLALRKRR